MFANKIIIFMITSLHAVRTLEFFEKWGKTEHNFRIPSAIQQASETRQPGASTGGFYRSHCSSCQVEWACFLYWEKYAQDFLHHSSTALTPFQNVIGFQPPFLKAYTNGSSFCGGVILLFQTGLRQSPHMTLKSYL